MKLLQSKSKKQYDGYVQYWSSGTNQIVNKYCGSLVVGHCTSVDLLEHFKQFGDDLGWNANLLHIGMDGPNVNLKFQNDLLNFFQETYGGAFLNIDSSTLHKVHNSFKSRVRTLPIDMYGFFKVSSGRREHYKNVEGITDATAQYVLRHSSVRWLTMKYVLIRIIEQWENLREYFCNFVPKQKIQARD